MLKKLLIITIFLIFTPMAYAQESKFILNKNTFCVQVDQAIKYIKKDKIRLIKIDSLIRDGWSYDSFWKEYVAFKLNTEIDKVFEYKSEDINSISKLMSNKEYISGTIFNYHCIKKSKRPNAIISKMDEETLLFYFTTSRLDKEGASGVIYFFIFNNNNKVIKVHKTSWIE